MQELDDNALLREYVEHQSEAAFAELVARHVDKVYSTAWRHTRNPHQAGEITQAVFVILAQKARKLGGNVILSGWLYQTARLTAVTLLRGEIRRARREQEALMQIFQNENEPDNWRHIAPLLDDALARLGEKDRHAVVLRFFDGKSFGEVGAALGGSEDAAKMRVSRALEKLRKMFARRGATFSVAAIAGAISTNSVHAAPAGLAKMISAVAMTKGAAAGSSTLTLAKGALKLMAWTKAKTAIVASAIVLLAAGTTTITVTKLIAPAPTYLKIEGKGQIELYSKVLIGPSSKISDEELKRIQGINKQMKTVSRLIETADISILTDGKSYRISIVSKGHSNLTNDFYDMTADYSCDGIDNFVLSDKLSYFHRTQEGMGGFAYSGRFPVSAPSVVAATWLGYCSKDYFNVSSNKTGLKLQGEFSTVWPDFITNQVTYWTNLTLPESITGWSRNWIIAGRTNSNQPKQAVELEQYPNGFKAWRFTASNSVMVGNLRVPRQITLERFFPKPPNTATSGDETEPFQKTTFTVDSVEIGKGKFNPLPPVTVPDLQIEDWRFKDLVGNFIIGSHVSPKGWPVRGSKTYKAALADAKKIAAENHDIIRRDLEREAQILSPP